MAVEFHWRLLKNHPWEFSWWMIWIDFPILNQFFISVFYPSWPWCITFLMWCWHLFANILFNIFVLIVTRDIALQFYLFVPSLSDLSINVIFVFKKQLGNFSSFSMLCNNLRSTETIWTLKVCKNFHAKQSVPGAYFVVWFLNSFL